MTIQARARDQKFPASPPCDVASEHESGRTERPAPSTRNRGNRVSTPEPATRRRPTSLGSNRAHRVGKCHAATSTGHDVTLPPQRQITSSRWCCRSSGRRSSCRRAASCRRRRGTAPSPGSRPRAPPQVPACLVAHPQRVGRGPVLEREIHRRRARRRRFLDAGQRRLQALPHRHDAHRLALVLVGMYATASRRKM